MGVWSSIISQHLLLDDGEGLPEILIKQFISLQVYNYRKVFVGLGQLLFQIPSGPLLDSPPDGFKALPPFELL